MPSNKIFSFLLVFVLTTGWLFSGWPQIWHNPPIPPHTQKASAATVHMLLFWDGGAAPSGWSIVTTYDSKFPRGESAANFGVTGGTPTHTPTSATVVNDTPAGFATSGSTAVSAYTHTHTSLSVTAGAASNLIVHKGLKLIQFDAGIPVSIPTGAIAVFDATAPSGWTRQSVLDGDMIMASSTTGTAYGSDTHTHTLTWSSLAAATASGLGNSANLGALTGHTHTAPAATASASITALPPYIQVIIAKADSATASLPNAMIAMFDGDPGSAWTIASNSGGAFYQNFIRGASTYSTSPSPAGASTHTHASAASGASGAPNTKAKGSSTGGTAVSGPTHTHILTATFNSIDNTPPYFNVVYAKKNTNVAPVAPTQNSPADAATSVSITPTFTMTTTDSDPDNISYKVTIYSNSGCTTVVQTNDQAVSATGWTGSNATCTASPTACYAFGTQGSYLTQSALSNSTQYWWKASAKDPDASATFTNSSTCNTFTTIAPVYSISITSSGVISYGNVTLSTASSTVSHGYTQTAQNDGNVTEKLNVKSSDATNGTGWTLASTIGSNQFKHEFSTTTGSRWDVMPDSATYVTANPSVAVSGTTNFDFRLTTPSASTDYQQKSITITVQAVAP